MSHLRARDDAEEVLSRCLPGQVGVVWYSDDNVYHERIFVWRKDALTWYIRRWRHAENFSGRDDIGPLTLNSGTSLEWVSLFIGLLAIPRTQSLCSM